MSPVFLPLRFPIHPNDSVFQRGGRPVKQLIFLMIPNSSAARSLICKTFIQRFESVRRLQFFVLASDWASFIIWGMSCPPSESSTRENTPPIQRFVTRLEVA